jgi:hypothetical protein
MMTTADEMEQAMKEHIDHTQPASIQEAQLRTSKALSSVYWDVWQLNDELVYLSHLMNRPDSTHPLRRQMLDAWSQICIAVKAMDSELQLHLHTEE